MRLRESEIGRVRFRRADFDRMTEFSEFNAKAQGRKNAGNFSSAPAR
jgi:hypothetical protein